MATGQTIGSIVAWGAGQAGQTGWPHYGQCDVPAPNSGFVAVAAGYYHSLAIRGDGDGDGDGVPDSLDL
ncbi:MAG: hypothetical protein WBL15_06370, partial [Phycisphaerae bacterium]